MRRSLSLALEHNLSAPAAEAYQRLADALEHSGDYGAARQTYVDAADFCEARGADLLDAVERYGQHVDGTLLVPAEYLEAVAVTA